MNKTKNRTRIIHAGLAFCVTLGIQQVGCNNLNTTNNSTTVKKTDTIAKIDNTSSVRNIGLTLPVLDALFFEDGFKADLKSKLKLTEQQIEKLKTAASVSVADLSEDGTDYLGSARAAKRQSEDQVSSILGQEKADQLYRLVAQRYAGGDLAGLFPAQPNSVPRDTRIVVNAPAFRMDIFQDGKLMKTYRVGIGYPEFPLPTGMRRADTIIFNPTWTPPSEPWVKGKFKAGKKVKAGSKVNPLGVIKIPIGMPSLIHGGKDASKLGNFASHGCVGLTNEQVRNFTLVLMQLGGNPITEVGILDLEKHKKKTQSTKLAHPVLVELRYETIVAENSGLHIYRDVYERGTNTLENATRVLKVYGINYESLTAQEKEALTNALTEMNRDSKGNSIADNINSEDTAIKKGRVAASKLDGAKKGKVTRSVKGRKDMVIAIAALQGKGYPGPVNLDTGLRSTAIAR
jgi:lipoprotein-anchoring transpeptidase ErfK/SrfK